ncbi:hypothetical protein ACX1C1_10310 [Paenibacillus sp. strain BS8-2]
MDDKPKQHDLRLLGTSESAGGHFAKLRITGEAKFGGHVSCRQLSLTGSASVHGNLEAAKMKLTGELNISGQLRYGNCSGVGDVVVDGDVRGEKVALSGRLCSGGFIEVEKLDIRGVLESEQGVNAGQARLRMYGPSRVKEIVGGSIIVRKSRGGKFKEVLKHSRTTITALEASLIEGDEVYVEWTRADIIRGAKVKIGPGCVVGRVDYRDSLHVHEKSSVGLASQL